MEAKHETSLTKQRVALKTPYVFNVPCVDVLSSNCGSEWSLLVVTQPSVRHHGIVWAVCVLGCASVWNTDTTATKFASIIAKDITNVCNITKIDLVSI